LASVVADHCGARPEMTTGGGTSDARFITRICPVVELGLVGDTMHQIDERVPVADIEGLSKIYFDILVRYFAAGISST
ncbi:MAG: M20/M25/M40 family metallo-hydrolase, partial [Pseudomonadota bacterium]